MEIPDPKRGNQMGNRMKIYIAGAIRGELHYPGYFEKVIEIVRDYGDPLTEKLAYTMYELPQHESPEEKVSREKRVAERDRMMLRESNAVIAEVSGPSTGTGWEICYATRKLRKPTLCLYNSQSLPSLIIKQDNSQYTLIQEYSDEKEFAAYVRCFLVAVNKSEGVDKVRRILRSFGRTDKSNILPYEIEKFVESSVQEIPSFAPIDFTDAQDFVQFLFRNLILQKKWVRLKSQRIGSTFVSGRKARIIKALSNFEHQTSLAEIYDRLGEDKIKYTYPAFTKNMRAFRKIGLILSKGGGESQIGQSQRGTKIKDQIEFFPRLDSGELNTRSSRSPRVTVGDLITVSDHLRHLASFLEKNGPRPLIDFFQRSKQAKWYSEIPEVQFSNVDKTGTEMVSDKELARKVVSNLLLECRAFWKEIYSSFA